MSTDDPITHACRLLREAAQELACGVSIGGVPDWANEPETKAAHDETVSAADALAALASQAQPVGAVPVAWRYQTPTGWHATTDAGAAARVRAHHPVEPLYAAPQPAAQALDADLWYLQDTRSYVGNDVVWWAKDGKGYTTDVSKAHVYGRDDAFRQAAARGVDRPWPKAYIDGKTRPAVDMQYIDHAAAIAAKQGGANGAD